MIGPGDGFPLATNVVVVVVVVVGVLVVIRFSIPEGSVISRPIIMKLSAHINDNFCMKLPYGKCLI